MTDVPYKNTYIPPEDENILMWRYMTFGRYFDLLMSSDLFFSRADKFIDKYEGHVNAHTMQLIDQEFAEFPNALEMRNKLKWLLDKAKTNAFVNCWHMNYDESLEMWKAYCPNEESVAIKTKFQNLLTGIDRPPLGPMHIRPIRYADQVDEEIDQTNFLDLLNYKRPEFAFEKELRILLFYIDGIQDPEDENSTIITPPEYGQKIRVNLENLIEEIYVAPNASQWFFELVKKITHLSLNKPVKFSKFKVNLH
jgi:hypothetical protein